MPYSLSLVTCDEISTIVSNLNKMPLDLMKLVSYITKCLCQVLQVLWCIFVICLFQKVCFPRKWKWPMYKCDDPMMFNHYRPVSLSCTLSKVFEKIMYNRLIKFSEKMSVLYEYQFGFRGKRSTHLALIMLMDQLTQAIGNGEYVIGGFFFRFFNGFWYGWS